MDWLLVADKLVTRSAHLILVFILLFQNQHQHNVVESWSSTSTSTSLRRHHQNQNQIISNAYWLPLPVHPPSLSSSFDSSSSSCHRRRIDRSNVVRFTTAVFAVESDDTTDDEDNTIKDDNTNNDNDDQEEEQEQEYMEIESLSSDQILELIELSFFQACFALSKGDVEPLKLFIVAVKTAAVQKFEGASAIAIMKTVNSLPSSIGRPLEQQEQELRDTWIQAIYLMLEHTLGDDVFVVGGSVSSSNDNNSVANTYGPILDDLVQIHNTGMGLNVNQFVSTRKDILMPKNNDNINPLVLDDDDDDDDLVQLAVVTQTVKLLYTTLEVLEGEGNDKYSYAVEEDDDDESSTGKGFGK